MVLPTPRGFSSVQSSHAASLRRDISAATSSSSRPSSTSCSPHAPQSHLQANNQSQSIHRAQENKQASKHASHQQQRNGSAPAALREATTAAHDVRVAHAGNGASLKRPTMLALHEGAPKTSATAIRAVRAQALCSSTQDLKSTPPFCTKRGGLCQRQLSALPAPWLPWSDTHKQPPPANRRARQAAVGGALPQAALHGPRTHPHAAQQAQRHDRNAAHLPLSQLLNGHGGKDVVGPEHTGLHHLPVWGGWGKGRQQVR